MKTSVSNQVGQLARSERLALIGGIIANYLFTLQVPFYLIFMGGLYSSSAALRALPSLSPGARLRMCSPNIAPRASLGATMREPV